MTTPHTAYRFPAETRAELAELFGSDKNIVSELEAAAQDYRARLSRRGETAVKVARVRAKADVRRIRTKARALLGAIDAAHPRVRFAAHRYRSIVDELARRCGGTSGAPVNSRRKQLEYAIGARLSRRGVRLTTSTDGRLARTLAIVLGAVDGGAPDVDRLRQICRRVRDDIKAERDGTAALDAWIESQRG